MSTDHPYSAQSIEGWVASWRPELLPPLPGGGAACGGDRYLAAPSWISLCEEGSTNAVIASLASLHKEAAFTMKQESEMPGERKEEAPGNSGSPDNSILSRRNILLAGTSLAATTAINAVDRTQIAQAQQSQQPQAPSGRKPNILVIWGDDVGIANISAYSNGLMGYETPGIDRIA